MAIRLDDHAELLQALPGEAQQLLHASWQEAARAFSPRGLDGYLRGALALHQLGRGGELVASYLEAMPALARAIGEDALPALVNALLGMASKTSGQVLALVAATAPVAAARLGDPDLFRDYLALLSSMLAQAPRGLRPLLENLERLLGQLTLGGLRRWVQWGAQAYRSDLEGQQRYFSLQSADALAVLQQERRGTLFVDVQRRLNLYLRALWGRDFFLRPTSGDYETRDGLRPYIEQHVIHLADAYDDWPAGADAGAAVPGLELYRAAANHCAAHLVFTPRPLSMQMLSPLQIAVIGAFEDARVETCAIRRFPNLRAAWLRLHPPVADGAPARLGELLDRLARALLEEAPQDPHPWVRQGVEAFRAACERPGALATAQTSWDLGVALVHALPPGLPEFYVRHDAPTAPYRDDNRALWQQEAYDEAEALAATWETRQQVRRKVNAVEMANEVDNEFAGDDAQEVWVLPTEFWLDQEGTTLNALEGRPPQADPVHYPEWDYGLQLERPGWATVLERHPPAGDPAVVEAILAEHRGVSARLKHLIEALVPQGLQRIRRLQDGDDLDLDAALRALLDLRLGQQPDTRIMLRRQRRTRDLAVLVLLDLSESANDPVRGQDYSVLELTRAATVLLAEALDRVGDAFALHGFCSNGRHDVHYYRFKDFEAPYDDLVRARLAAMRAGYSTRMGAALRHAGGFLARRAAARRVCFVVTDGAPADNDVRDPRYCREDARRAVEELARAGIATYALSLDAHADEYVERIFGAGRYTVLEHPARLPETLPRLYLGLTR